MAVPAISASTLDGPRARTRRAPWKLLLIPLVLVVTLAASAFAVDAAFASRALPGLTVGGIAVGSLERAELRERLEAEIARPWGGTAVVATLDGRAWRTTNAALGVGPDVDAAVEAALRFGKNGGVAERIAAWQEALAGGAQIPFAMRVNGDAAERWVASLAAEIDRPVIEGVLAVRGGAIAVTQPSSGRVLDQGAALAAVVAPASLGEREVALSVRATHPAVDDAGIADAVAFARAATVPLELSANGRTAKADAAVLAGLLKVERVVAAAGELPQMPAGAIAPPARYRYAVSVDGWYLDEWIIAAAERLDVPAKNATYRVNPDRSLAVVPSAAGSRVDQAALRALLAAELAKPAQGATRAVAAPTRADVPVFTTEQATRYTTGMTQIGTFETYFPVSAARFTNISVGASYFHDLVVAPGETSSFWRVLGPDVESRLVPAGAIVNGRSDDSVVGGGLCQVSTTLFNVVARAGYQIVERHEHSYLIERYPLGLDAAVFYPYLDLTWKNDTPYPVLIRSWTTQTSVGFELFSIPTGRQVAFGAAVESNFKDVPPTQAADPAFPPGYALKGRDVVRTRTVTENGRVVHSDTWKSHYDPVWGGPAR